MCGYMLSRNQKKKLKNKPELQHKNLRLSVKLIKFFKLLICVVEAAMKIIVIDNLAWILQNQQTIDNET